MRSAGARLNYILHTHRGATQVELEELYSKYQLHECIAREFRAAGLEGELEEMGIPGRFGIDLLVQMQLHKRATIPTLVGLLKKHFEGEENPAQACADMILEAAEADAIEVLDQTDPIAVVVFEMDEETQEKLDQFQYPLPMIEEPQPVTALSQGGSGEPSSQNRVSAGKRLICCRHEVLLKAVCEHETWHRRFRSPEDRQDRCLRPSPGDLPTVAVCWHEGWRQAEQLLAWRRIRIRKASPL